MSGALLQAGMIAGGRVLTVDDFPATISDLGGATTTYAAEIQLQTDGDLWELKDVGSDVLRGGWVDPKSGAKTTDAVKRDYISGDNTHHVGTLAENTYQALTGSQSYGIRYTSSGGSDDISTVTEMTVAEDTGGTGAVGPASITFTAGEIF